MNQVRRKDVLDLQPAYAAQLQDRGNRGDETHSPSPDVPILQSDRSAERVFPLLTLCYAQKASRRGVQGRERWDAGL